MKNKQSKNKKGILETMYDTIMEKGGPVGPISQSLVDLWEKPIEPSPEDKKIIIGYLKKGAKNSLQKKLWNGEKID